MELTGLKDKEGRDVTIVISDDGYPHHHVLRVYATSAPDDELLPRPTREELFSTLEEKGYKEGTRIKGLRFDRICKMSWDNVSESGVYGKYNYEDDQINVYDETNNVWELIYSKGQWAEIISPPKKHLPKTKEELKSSLIKFGIDFSENITREDVEEFLENYED